MKKHSDLGNMFCETMQLFQFSEVVMTELTAAVRNFTRNTTAASYISQSNVGILVTLAVKPMSEKVQALAIDCLKNLQKVPDLERQIKAIGGHEVLMLLGERNQF